MKRMFLVCGAVVVGLAFAASPVVAQEFNLDHYKCYKVKDLKQPKFVRTTVNLEDQFGVNDGRFELKKPFLLCTPVDKNFEGIINPDDHLTCYKMKEVTADKRFVRPTVVVENQLGSSTLQPKKAWLLCVPSTKTVLP